MCFSQFAQYTPRPIQEYTTVRPTNAPPTKAEQDPNLFGAIPTPPEWRVAVEPEAAHMHDNGQHQHDHEHQVIPNNRAAVAPQATVYAASSQDNKAEIASVSTQTVEAVVVELSNGTRLLVCPL